MAETIDRPDLLKIAYRVYWNAKTPNEERIAYILIQLLGGKGDFTGPLNPDSTPKA